MRDLATLLLHLLVTVARLAGPGGARAVVAESVLVRHPLLILNRREVSHSQFYGAVTIAFHADLDSNSATIG